jgi:hypothetical protein
VPCARACRPPAPTIRRPPTSEAPRVQWRLWGALASVGSVDWNRLSAVSRRRRPERGRDHGRRGRVMSWRADGTDPVSRAFRPFLTECQRWPLSRSGARVERVTGVEPAFASLEAVEPVAVRLADLRLPRTGWPRVPAGCQLFWPVCGPGWRCPVMPPAAVAFWHADGKADSLCSRTLVRPPDGRLHMEGVGRAGPQPGG